MTYCALEVDGSTDWSIIIKTDITMPTRISRNFVLKTCTRIRNWTTHKCKLCNKVVHLVRGDFDTSSDKFTCLKCAKSGEVLPLRTRSTRNKL